MNDRGILFKKTFCSDLERAVCKTLNHYALRSVLGCAKTKQQWPDQHWNKYVLFIWLRLCWKYRYPMPDSGRMYYTNFGLL